MIDSDQWREDKPIIWRCSCIQRREAMELNATAIYGTIMLTVFLVDVLCWIGYNAKSETTEIR
jgi:hypothetical protein